MNEVQNPGSVNEPQTPEVTPQTRDTLLEQLNFLIDGARSNLMDMKASLAIDGPLLKPEPQYTKEQVVAVEVEVSVSDGGFTYDGGVTIEEDTIREVISFDTHKMSDEHIEEILKS